MDLCSHESFGSFTEQPDSGTCNQGDDTPAKTISAQKESPDAKKLATGNAVAKRQQVQGRSPVSTDRGMLRRAPIMMPQVGPILDLACFGRSLG